MTGPEVTFCVLNLRMGGQVANLVGLADLLRARGLRVGFALPEGVAGPDKQSLARFACRPLLQRARALWRMLRALPAGPGHVVHLVLPTPAFAPLCRLLPTPLSRLLVQSEGLPTSLDAEHRRAFRDDPAFVLPRLALNHVRWVKAARGLPLAHLVTTPAYARLLTGLGFRDVTCVENLARFTAEDGAPLSADLDAFLAGGDPVVAYIGHAHPVKGVDDLVRAFALAQPRRPGLALLLALSGDGDARRVLRLVAGLPSGVRARIRVEGVVPVQRVLARVDALALPYRSLLSTTLYPSLLLEAGEAACPLLVSDLPELRDLFGPASPRLRLLRPGDGADLAEALAALPRRSVSGVHPPALRLPDPEARITALIDLYERLDRAREHHG